MKFKGTKEQANDVILFEVGKTYYMTSACDQDCVWKYKITRRTIQTVILEGIDGNQGSGRKRIGFSYGVEYVSPLGRHAFAPMLMADKVWTEDPPVDEDSDPIVRLLKDAVRKEYGKLADKVEVIHVSEEQ